MGDNWEVVVFLNEIMIIREIYFVQGREKKIYEFKGWIDFFFFKIKNVCNIQ